MKNIPHPSPPRLQATQFINEDLSPPTSLLFSASESSSESEQIPQTRRFNGRKKHPCRHFLRTGGWCPVGTKCKFFHDVAALPDTVPLPSAGVQSSEQSSPSETDEYGEKGRTISGGVLMGIQAPSPPIISEKFPEPPRDAHVQSRQPVYWPNYWQAYQPYYATVPATNTVPLAVSAVPSPHVHHSVHSLPPTQAHTIPSNETQNNLPSGTYEVNGTTYFPPSMPPVPAPAPVTYPVPVHPAPYNHMLAPPYPYYAPPAPPSYYSIFHRPTDIFPSTNSDFDPFRSDPIMPSELPVIPQCEDYRMPAMQHVVLPLQASSPSAPSGDLVSTTAIDKPAAHEFPYQPPKNQRGGHARRISVNIKKHNRASSG